MTSPKLRNELERRIVRQAVRDILAKGYRLAVSLERGYDLEEMLPGSTSEKEIMDAAFAGDECHLFVQPATGPTVEDEQVVSEGWVFLVMGNGECIISDYTTGIEDLLSEANKIADSYA